MTRQRHIVCLLLIALMLFAQGAVAYAACFVAHPCAAQAMTAHHSPGCPEGKHNRNLCLAHGTSQDQRADAGDAPATLPALPLDVGLLVPAAHEIQTGALHVADVTPAVSPPIPILFHNFRS